MLLILSYIGYIPDDLASLSMYMLTFRTIYDLVAYHKESKGYQPVWKMKYFLSSIAIFEWAVSSLPIRCDNRDYAPKLLLAAAQIGSIPILKQEIIKYKYPMTHAVNMASTRAAHYGQLHVLKWLQTQETPCPWESHHLNCAADGGHLETFRWLINQYQYPPVLCDDETPIYAVRSGNLAILQLSRSQYPQCPLYISTTNTAAECGRLEILQWLMQQDPPCQYNNKTTRSAAIGGHIAVLQFLRNLDPPCPWDTDTCEFAARFGHLAILQWLRNQDPPCPWDVNTCTAAVNLGDLAMLQWLRNQNPPCPWDVNTCTAAANMEDLAMLQWLRNQNPPCPWDVNTCAVAANLGDLAMLQWLRNQNPPCPWDITVCRNSLHNCIKEWMHQFGEEVIHID